MQKYPIYIQDEEMSCGAYCILMILKYYGYNEDIQKIKEKTRLNQNGITIKGLVECLKQYQIESKAYEASLKDIQEQVRLPCILYMVYDNIGQLTIYTWMTEPDYL